jgi:hypothetical protein
MIPQVISAVSGFASLSGLVGPLTTISNYGGNLILPVEMPQWDELANCWLKGFSNAHKFWSNSLYRGVDVGNDLSPTLTQYAAWIPEQRQITVSTDFLARPTTPWEDVIRNRLFIPDVQTLGILRNRKIITQELYNFAVGRQVDSNPLLVAAHNQLRYETPGPSDLVRFAVREAFNPELITLFGYNKEFPTQILPLMEGQGYGGPTGLSLPAGSTDGDNNNRVGGATWSDLYWWSHWELPSLTSGYEMLHRLYPDSEYGPSPLVTDDTSFTSDKLELLQKAQDIPDYWRKRLQAISYNPISTGEGDYMYETGLIEEDDLYHIYRAAGHSDDDCKIMLAAARQKKDRYVPLGIGDLEYLYIEGLVGDTQVRDVLTKHGYSNDNIILMTKMYGLKKQRSLETDPGKESQEYVCKYYKMGLLTDREAIDSLKGLGYEEWQADRFLGKCVLEIKGETVLSTIKTLEQAFYRGIYDVESLKLEFIHNGLNPDVTDFWVQRWKYKRDVTFKSASAKQNLTAFKNGVLTEAYLVARLFNLGYDGSSINVMVANQKMQIIQAQTAALAKQARADAKAKALAAAAALKAQQKATKKDQQDAKIVTNQANKRLRAFIKASSDANIKSWYKDKLISLWEVYYRLYYKGYIIRDADHWVTANFKDATQGEKDAAAKKAQSQFRAEGNYLE